MLSEQDFAEAIAQLAMFPPGREALLHDPNVAEALHKVAAEGWEEEAQQFAESALLAMSGRQPDAGHAQHDHKHIIISYQWDVQVRAESAESTTCSHSTESTAHPTAAGGGEACGDRAAGPWVPHVVRCARCVLSLTMS